MGFWYHCTLGVQEQLSAEHIEISTWNSLIGKDLSYEKASLTITT